MQLQQSPVDPTTMFRMPWSLTDNVLGWLEPTKKCNLTCEGCYSRNDPNSEKTLAQVRSDLDIFTSKRKVDSISIAGGDPLTHPDIVEIVRMIRHDFGLKPIVNTNGIDLDQSMLEALVDAGVAGFTLHIDSGQKRKGWHGKNELELCELRDHFAQMISDVGDIGCAFNMTVYRHTAKYVPDLMDWASKNIHRVHTMVFILFRTMRSEEFDYYAHGTKIERDDSVYLDQELNAEPLTTPEVVDLIRTREPSFAPAAYLGGTVDPSSLKWTIGARFGDGERIHGYVGPRFMEFVQNGHHMFTGRYLAYSKPSVTSMGRAMLPAFGLFDKGVRTSARRWLQSSLLHPTRAAKRVHLQSVLIIQPIDHMPDGQTNMCDGCPDITVHNGELVWSCRLDERVQWGCFVHAVPREGAAGTPQYKGKSAAKAKPAAKPKAKAKPRAKAKKATPPKVD